MCEKGKKGKGDCCGESKGARVGCCKVESVVTVDARGQMVLPKEIRQRAGIKAGDKLAVISCEKGNKVHCISLVKASDYAKMVKDVLGPLMKDIMG
ncbi:MAG: HgcAB-associated protein [Candidatus Eisenbacteria bacterium]|nr:HgcAB-associated protein [Candidatus Eisenbacteria bacterium]